MRRKIAKRKRRYALRKGAEILHEGWCKEPEWNDKYYEAHVRYCGWTIMAPGRDELEVYNGVLACFPGCEKEPFEGFKGPDEKFE